jgi:small subunit ribosomal protein S19e
MASVKDVCAADFISAFAGHLKKAGKLEVPKWVEIAKMASFKELCPADQDWFYTHSGMLRLYSLLQI